MLRKRPLREFLVVLAALGGTCAPPAGASAEPATRLALVGGMLLDGYGGAPLNHAAIGRWFRWLEVHRAEYPLERVMELSARQLLFREAARITLPADTPARP